MTFPTSEDWHVPLLSRNCCWVSWQLMWLCALQILDGLAIWLINGLLVLFIFFCPSWDQEVYAWGPGSTAFQCRISMGLLRLLQLTWSSYRTFCVHGSSEMWIMFIWTAMALVCWQLRQQTKAPERSLYKLKVFHCSSVVLSVTLQGSSRSLKVLAKWQV